jgi:hypothetical protein
MNCARCYKRLLPTERVVADPCCSAPDCQGLTDQSHYDCLPLPLQQIEDDLEEMLRP